MSTWISRGSILTVLCAIAAMAAPAAEASFGVTESHFEAGTCNVSSCTYSSPTGDFYTQAAGHPPYGITSFELNSKGGDPEGTLKRVRVDIPPGLAADPEALEKCPIASFEAGHCASEHPNSLVGTNELTAYAEPSGLFLGTTIENSAPVYNLEQPPGLPLDFGIEVSAPPLLDTHIFLQGHVDTGGDYHEYFEINEITKEVVAEVGPVKIPTRLAVLKSKLIFKGQAGGNFLTLPSVCSSSTTSYLEVESYEGAISKTETHTPVGVEGCESVPFKPTAALYPETSAADQPDGATTVVKVPQYAGAGEINSSDIDDGHITLPEGMTLNPSAAHGLEACAALPCPAASRVGSVTIETDLPPKSLTGGLYLGDPGGGPITKPPFTVYLEATSVYGVTVKLTGTVTPNLSTGRLEASFDGNPQLPFSELILSLNGGPRAPLANPLTCASTSIESFFTPYTGTAAFLSSSPFSTNSCPSPAFALAQSTKSSSGTAGAYTSYTFDLTRPTGQQYLSQLQTVLPPGLVGSIPSVPLCGEPQASLGTCSSASEIGTATVSAGAGSEPYSFSGPVFLTGRYNGAPYGLSIPVNAVAGPFDFGKVITRATIGVDPYSGRVIATSSLPRIVEGVPLRLQDISVAVTRSNFLFNPTNCQEMATNSVFTSTLGSIQNASSPFQVSGCSGLTFKPSLSASTNAKTSKTGGASLQVNLVQGAHEANIRSVVTSLPKQLPSRLTTIQKACPEATFAANPLGCSKESEVGSVAVTTPVLPGVLAGPAFLVSHGGAAFPNLDLVLDDGGVRVILVGNTTIRGGVTTESFPSIPDVPASSFVLTLPTGPHSALGADGSLCAKPLAMPTIITAQSGAQFKQSTPILVAGCGVRIVRRRVVHHTLLLTVQTIGPGRVRVAGKNLKTVSRSLGKGTTVTLKVPLVGRALTAVRRHRRLRLSIRVTFAPQQRGQPGSSASTTLTIKR